MNAMIEDARSLPMTANCVVPRHESLLLLDDIRDSFPGELDDAQDVLDQRDRVLADADASATENALAGLSRVDGCMTSAMKAARKSCCRSTRMLRRRLCAPACRLPAAWRWAFLSGNKSKTPCSSRCGCLLG